MKFIDSFAGSLFVAFVGLLVGNLLPQPECVRKIAPRAYDSDYVAKGKKVSAKFVEYASDANVVKDLVGHDLYFYSKGCWNLTKNTSIYRVWSVEYRYDNKVAYTVSVKDKDGNRNFDCILKIDYDAVTDGEEWKWYVTEVRVLTGSADFHKKFNR